MVKLDGHGLINETTVCVAAKDAHNPSHQPPDKHSNSNMGNSASKNDKQEMSITSNATGSTTMNKKKNKSRGGYDSSEFRRGPNETQNEFLVRAKWCEATSYHRGDIVRKFTRNDAVCVFKGGETAMSFPVFIATCEALWASFPDNKVSWESVKEIRPGVVLIKDYRAAGTHTGAPYSFGPYKPIPATGKYVEEDPCQLTLHIKKGKVSKFQIDVRDGDLVGPPGYYQKIGGDFSMVHNGKT